MLSAFMLELLGWLESGLGHYLEYLDGGQRPNVQKTHTKQLIGRYRVSDVAFQCPKLYHAAETGLVETTREFTLEDRIKMQMGSRYEDVVLETLSWLTSDQEYWKLSIDEPTPESPDLRGRMDAVLRSTDYTIPIEIKYTESAWPQKLKFYHYLQLAMYMSLVGSSYGVLWTGYKNSNRHAVWMIYRDPYTSAWNIYDSNGNLYDMSEGVITDEYLTGWVSYWREFDGVQGNDLLHAPAPLSVYDWKCGIISKEIYTPKCPLWYSCFSRNNEYNKSASLTISAIEEHWGKRK